MTVRYKTIDDSHAGQRLDNFLMTEIGRNVPKSLIYRIIRKGEVRVNKGRIKPDYRLKMGDEVRIPPVKTIEKQNLKPSQSLVDLIAERILYEDEALLIINKPSGIAVHGGSTVSIGLMDAVKALRPDEKFLELGHRLDKGTSGCILIAKKRWALLEFQNLLRAGKVTKRYLALSKGQWKNKELMVDVPLLKNERNTGERIVMVSNDGKSAQTQFTVKEVYKGATLVEANLLTGRTHQIRAHAKYRKHPLAGDDKYGDDDFNQEMKQLGLKRLFLHAFSLKFSLPSMEKAIKVLAPLDNALEQCLMQLEKQ